MAVPNKWFNQIVLRSMLASFGFRSPSSVKEYEFEPYFQYSIGPYKTGYTLYFPKQPFKLLYKNEIFAKMMEYSGHDLTNYLGFHYAAYKDKKEFIRFLRYEAIERLKKTRTASYKLNLEMTLEWVAEQSPKGEIPSPAGTNLLPKRESPPGTDEIYLSVETTLGAITESYSGKIALYNQHQMQKVIQVFILIQTMKAPGKKAEPLFEHFTKTDIAAILRQFEENNNKKPNTLQGYVTDANNMLRLDDPKVEKLATALQNFFY
jgi:hypothetical protein